MTGPRKKIWGCTLGNCIHVAGIHRFMELAKEYGYDTYFAGAGLGTEAIVRAVVEIRPEVVALSYRLTPEVASRLLTELKARVEGLGLPETVWVFGGTPPICAEAEQSGLFTAIFGKAEDDDGDVLRWLKGEPREVQSFRRADTLLARIRDQAPYPLLRHHFGLPDLEATIDGVAEIAESKVLDVISIGPDQNAQEFFFRPEEMDPAQNGAGGVPLRKVEDLRRLYEASRRGNFPLLRIYSGTRDLLRWAELAVQELHNAWAAIPLYWYSVMDGRSKRSITETIRENHAAMAWYGARGIPVEVNEAHHWSLRGASDETAVAAAYLAAYNAKAMGVQDFILQLMWNTPPQIPAYKDLGKMLAKIEMTWGLKDDNFRIWKQARAGLASLSPQPDVAKGQLAASTMLSLQVSPEIVHVVGFCEGDHAATPSEIIVSCCLVRGVLKNCLYGLADMKLDPKVQEYKWEVMEKAWEIVDRIRTMDSKTGDPLTDPEALAQAVRKRIMVAPQMMKEALGQDDGVKAEDVVRH